MDRAAGAPPRRSSGLGALAAAILAATRSGACPDRAEYDRPLPTHHHRPPPPRRERGSCHCFSSSCGHAGGGCPVRGGSNACAPQSTQFSLRLRGRVALERLRSSVPPMETRSSALGASSSEMVDPDIGDHLLDHVSFDGSTWTLRWSGDRLTTGRLGAPLATRRTLHRARPPHESRPRGQVDRPPDTHASAETTFRIAACFLLLAAVLAAAPSVPRRRRSRCMPRVRHRMVLLGHVRFVLGAHRTAELRRRWICVRTVRRLPLREV